MKWNVKKWERNFYVKVRCSWKQFDYENLMSLKNDFPAIHVNVDLCFVISTGI